MSLLGSTTLIVDQILTVFSPNFAITDLDGQQVGTIRCEDGASRVLLLPRNFVVSDETGRAVLHIEDVIDFGRDRLVIADLIDGQTAKLVKEITFFRTEFTLTLFDDTELTLSGDFFDHEFVISGPRGEYALVSRSWGGVVQALLGLDRYVVKFAPTATPNERLAILGGVIAIDLVRAKQSS